MIFVNIGGGGLFALAILTIVFIVVALLCQLRCVISNLESCIYSWLGLQICHAMDLPKLHPPLHLQPTGPASCGRSFTLHCHFWGQP